MSVHRPDPESFFRSARVGLLGVVFLAGLGRAQEGAPDEDPARVPGAVQLPDAVRARLDREHARQDEFDAETLSGELTTRLQEALEGAEVPRLFGPDATLRWHWLEAELTGQSDPVRVTWGRAGEDGENPIVPAALEWPKIAARLGSGPYKLKVLRSERRGDAFLHRVRIRTVVHDSESVEPKTTTTELDLRFDWRLVEGRWSVDSVAVERSAVSASKRALVDVAGAVLSAEGSLAARDRLLPSIGALRLGLDARLGVGFLGHHGVAVGDVNGDGIEDFYLCQPGGLPDQLWLRDGRGAAHEVARDAGVDLLDATSSALLVDLDGDGDADLARTTGYALLVHPNVEGRFGTPAGIPVEGATSLAAADVDLDGRLELFVCTYGSPYTGGGLPVPYHDARNGTANRLLYNRTTTPDEIVFSDVTGVAGLAEADQRFSFAASFEDYDGDGDPDLYVANDFGRNRLWRNEEAEGGARFFVDVAAEYGVEDLAAGMGVTWADFDLDGQSDLYVSNMYSSAGNRVAYDARFHADASGDALAAYRRHASGNSLFLRRGDGFVRTGQAFLGRWAWGSLAFELDGDGRPDVYVPNGFVTGTRADDL